MDRSQDNLNDALRFVEAGDLDALSPDQAARLEAVLNDEPLVAARVSNCIPTPDPALAAALEQLEKPAWPSAERWNRVWGRIEAATPSGFTPGGRGLTRILQIWKPLAAAAACLVLAALWTGQTPAMQLATDVVINELEVGEGALPFVVSVGGDEGIKVIWVLEGES
ncbi:MAG: hypothetical protein KAY37_15305 [Phycisphaerae bacterium]|nr:hypothetical protein [Phycisphaerae bacterium]